MIDKNGIILMENFPSGSCYVLLVSMLTILIFSTFSKAQNSDSARVEIKKCSDFKINGEGSDQAWEKTDWIRLPQRSPGDPRDTYLKILYSDSGLYFLFNCQDTRLTATLKEDFLDLWNEDVVEVFLWPDKDYPVYFEYELSPLNYELPLLIPNLKGKFLGWRPWHYQGERKVRHATSVQGSQKESGSVITGWKAEFFIPFQLLSPLGNVPPGSGTTWRVNFYRCDYDTGKMEYWSWRPIKNRFHEFEKFGLLSFQ